MDQYMTHMLMPVGNIQSKGLPSNGVLGNGQVSPPPLQTEELKATLMQQVEYYFSKDNLATDKYLCKCMRYCLELCSKECCISMLVYMYKIL